jgi:hypothetical protein
MIYPQKRNDAKNEVVRVSVVGFRRQEKGLTGVLVIGGGWGGGGKHPVTIHSLYEWMEGNREALTAFLLDPIFTQTIFQIKTDRQSSEQIC